MKPYILIEGSSQSIGTFEQKVTDALEQGYSLAGELIAQSSSHEIKFFQPMMLEEDDFDDEDDEEFDSEED